MKKILFALALACSLQLAYAQKPDADMQKAVDKALAASQDAKKGAKPATWVNLGKAYINAYKNPTSQVIPGLDKTSFSLSFKEKPVSVSQVTIDGVTFEKQSFSHVDVYFNQNGMLQFADVTRQSVPGDLLMLAAKAYSHAFELGAKDKDVDPRLQEIVDLYYNDAFMAYTLGDQPKAHACFKGAADVSVLPPCSARNDDAHYNAALTALTLKDYNTAEEYYNKCLAVGYTSEGNIYGSLSECALAKADTLAAKNYLATGLTAYPDNALILTNLINLYLQTKEEPEKIVELLDEAKQAMPDNPSLYYVEGNIYSNLGKLDEANAAYVKSLEIDPKYDMGFFGQGQIILKRAEILVDEMNALDYKEWQKYDQMQSQLWDLYKQSLPLFESAYDVTSNPQVKLASADFLKRINFQLRGQGSEFQQAYEKWNAVVNESAE